MYPNEEPLVISPSRPGPIVPLCQNAKSYIIQKGKTLPASFLATLLPAPGFLEDLNESLQPPTSLGQEPLNNVPSSHVEALQLPTGPQLEPPHQIPSSSAMDKDSELDSLGTWAGTDLLTAEASPDQVCPPVVQLEDSFSELPPKLADIPNPAISSLGDYLQFICGSVISQSEMILS